MSKFKSEFDKLYETITEDSAVNEGVAMDSRSAYHTVLEVLEIIHTAPSIDNGPWDVSMYEAHGGHFIVFTTHNAGNPIGSNIEAVLNLTKAAVIEINKQQPDSLDVSKVKVAVSKTGTQLVDEKKALIDVLGYTG